jgi:hypothetical protein
MKFMDVEDATPEVVRDIVDMCIWGLSSPENWPTRASVKEMMEALMASDQAHHPAIRQAIGYCIEYLRPDRESDLP